MIEIKKAYRPKKLKKNQIVLDIETTGLDRENDFLVLLGLILYKDEKAFILQYFAERNCEEKELLEIYKNLTFNKEIISYNGKNFDIPFLESRLAKNGMDPYFPPKNYDIYEIIKKYRDYFDFKSMKLIDIEKIIGIDRNDPSRYKAPSKIRNDEKRENPDPILIHNQNDIKSTEELIDIQEIIDNILTIDLGKNKLTLKKVYINNNICKINLKSEKSLQKAVFFNDNYNLKAKDKDLEILINVLYGKISKNTWGYVSLNPYELENESYLPIDRSLISIKEGRIFKYENILNLSAEILKESFKAF